MNGLIEKDQQLLLFLNGLGSSSFDPFWLMITGNGSGCILHHLAYYLFKSFPLKKFIFILIFLAIGIAISDQLAGIFKIGVARLRPCHTEALMSKMRLVTCGGQFGFYSSHASIHFFWSVFYLCLLGKNISFYHIFSFCGLY
jgi:undecaprenyl-diphosphatase